MALVLTRWRTWLALAVLGSAGAFGYRGDWAWCAGAAALVLLRVACCFWLDMLTTMEVKRAFAKTLTACAALQVAREKFPRQQKAAIPLRTPAPR